ncbi:MAG TPA: hypothetical protein DDW23_08470 [Planctomycetes bacterium]|nr:hypothetical protein [Planctomycetota bacterium]
MGVIATLLLSLAPPAQEETPWLEEFRTRTLAAKWEASPPPLEDLPQMWATAPLKEKGRFAAAAARGLKGSKTCLEFALLGLSLKPIPPTAWDAAQTCKIDARLEMVLAKLATDPEHAESALEAALKQGVFPFPSKPNWITNLSSKERAIVAVGAKHLLDRGWIPSSDLAELLTTLPMLRSRLLDLLAGRDLDDEAERLRTLDVTTWAAEEKVAFDILLLDNGVAISKKQKELLLKNLFSDALPSATRETLAERALLHADMFAEEVQTINFAAPGYFDWLLKAPESAAYGPLLEYALGTSFPPARRGKAVLRLMRAWGERATDDLLPLVQPRQHTEILRSIFAGMRNFAQTRHAPALLAAEPGKSSNLESIWIEACAAALPLTEFSPLLEQATKNGSRSLIHRLGRNAWEDGEHAKLLALFWEWVDSPRAAVWQAGLRLLDELLTPAEVGAGLRARFDAEESPSGRFARVQQAQSLRTPEALSLYCHWLASSEGLAHPESATMAAILFQEEPAREMFQTWWNRRKSLRPEQVAAAAICLAPINAEARKVVWEILPEQTAPAQQAWIVFLSQDPQPGDAQQCANLIRDTKTTTQVKKVGAVGLVRSLPESYEIFQEILSELLNNPDSAPESARQMVLGGIHFGDDAVRDWVRNQVEKLGTDHPLRPRLTSSVTRARTSSPRASELAADSSTAHKSLLLGFSELPPSSKAPEGNNAKGLPGSEDFAQHVGILGAHGAVADASLGEWLAAEPRPALLHPDRLWILAQNKSSLPVSAAAAAEILRRFEAPSSWRLATIFPQPQKLPLNFELEVGALFSALEERIASNNILAGTVDILTNARARFPADRRAFDLSGWWALSHGRINDARGFFRASMRRSGLLPAIQREPRLGLAVCELLENPASTALEDEIKMHETRDLLGNRLFGETRVRLQDYLNE